MKISLLCDQCGKSFQKEKGEYNRSKKLGRKHFCQQACASSFNNRVRDVSDATKSQWISRLKSNNRQDEFSPFRYYRNKAVTKQRLEKYGESDLTLNYLKSLWESQNGICVYTGHKMDLPRNTKEHDKLHTPFSASLDRIDSSKGYVQGNVEFVCLAANYAKNKFDRQQMIDFFKRA